MDGLKRMLASHIKSSVFDRSIQKSNNRRVVPVKSVLLNLKWRYSSHINVLLGIRDNFLEQTKRDEMMMTIDRSIVHQTWSFFLAIFSIHSIAELVDAFSIHHDIFGILYNSIIEHEERIQHVHRRQDATGYVHH